MGRAQPGVVKSLAWTRRKPEAMPAVGLPETGFIAGFTDSLKQLSSQDQEQCWKALTQFARNPSHPGLQFGPIQGSGNKRLFKIRAALDVRVVLAKEGNLHFAVLAGKHDQVYERARRGRFVIDLFNEDIVFLEPPAAEVATSGQEPAGQPPWEPTTRPSRGLVLHWTNSELEAAGLAEAEIATIRSLESAEQLLELLGDSWAEDRVDLVFELQETTPEVWRTPDLLGDRGEILLRRAIEEFGALHGISRLFTPDELASIANNPIEDWMVFLHPDQRFATRSSYAGPARIRGSVGTGKTVVALHWAAERARRSTTEDRQLPVLFTTFVRTLPPVFENLYNRMPDSVPGAVEFVNIHALAYKLCVAAGDNAWVNQNHVDQASKAAFDQVVRGGTPLANDGIDRPYMESEVRAVIKGRGLRSVDEYLNIQRTGRGTRFEESRRRQAWAYMEEWNARMAQLDTRDYEDNVTRAVELSQGRSDPTYRAAVVDEAQDLTLMGLQLVRTLVNGGLAEDRPDGLLIVGDGAQRIYPGAFTLRQAGVEVRGRTTILRQNYRNTAEILTAAMAVLGKGPIVDMEDEDDGDPSHFKEERGDADRSGLRPLLVDCGSDEREGEFLVEKIRAIVASGIVGYGDIGIFVPINHMVGSIKRLLDQNGIPASKLAAYDGTPTPEVKVGTYARSKGLEFKVVLLPRVKGGTVPKGQTANQSDEAYAEQRELEVNQFFVAMTRARDQLIVSFGDQPSEVLVGVINEFEALDFDDPNSFP